MCSDGQLMDLFDRALDALLRWPLSQASLAGPRRIHPSERVTKEVELPFRNPADPCLILVHRQLQLTHDPAQVVKRRFGVASSAQDHEVVGIRDQASTGAPLKAELLPAQPEPSPVEGRQ